MKEKRTCKCCNQEKLVSEFYTNGINNYSSICKECTLFKKKAKYYKDKMEESEYNKWYADNIPIIKKTVISEEERIKNGFIYKTLLDNNNCYVKKLDNVPFEKLEALLNKTITVRQASDHDGYVLETKK